MPFRTLEHTGDLALEVTAASLEELYAEALRGLTDCVTELESVEPRVERRLEARAPDRELLLVEWLGEALYAFETRGELYCRATVELAGDGGELRLSARVAGELYDAGRHPHKVLVKAVTYHRLAVEQAAGGWRARLVLDI